MPCWQGIWVYEPPSGPGESADVSWSLTAADGSGQRAGGAGGTGGVSWVAESHLGHRHVWGRLRAPAALGNGWENTVGHAPAPGLAVGLWGCSEHRSPGSTGLARCCLTEQQEGARFLVMGALGEHIPRMPSGGIGNVHIRAQRCTHEAHSGELSASCGWRSKAAQMPR